MKQILDSSAIIRGDLDFAQGGFVVTNGVLLEIRDQTTKEILNSHMRKGNIELGLPSDQSLDEIEKKAKKTSDLQRLSYVDKEILALAYEKGYSILTDDYSIQNLAKELSIEYHGLSQDGIRERLEWYLVCEGCGKRYPYEKEIWECDVCGSDLMKRTENR